MYTFKTILKNILTLKKDLIKAHVIAIIAIIISLPIPLLIPLLVDEILLKEGDILQTLLGEQKEYVYIWSMFFLGITFRFLYFIFSSYQSLLFAKISKQVILDIQTKMLKHLKNISMPEYELMGNGKISSYFLIDLLSVDKFLSITLNKFIISVISLLFIFIILFVIHWQLALLIFFLNPFVAIMTKKIAKKVSIHKKNENKSFSIFTDSLNETLDMFIQLKALSKENSFFEILNNKSKDIKDKSIEFTYKSTLASSFSYFIFLSGFELFRACGILFVFYDDLSIGLMLSVFGYLWVIMGPIQSIIDIQYSFNNAKVSLERINELFEIKLENKYGASIISKDILDIKLDNLTFGYSNNIVIHNKTLEIKSGEKIALIGESGKGKSTLAKLIVGLYQPQSGEILVNNVNINKYNFSSLRQNIYLVLQQSFMFNSTIKENLTLGSTIEEEAIIKALKDVELWNIIEKEKDGLDTLVGKNGIRLSGGQIQRVAIARMLLQNPQVIIFDESTSAIDIDLEKKIFHNIHKFLKDKTVVYIAHRKSTLMYANTIIEL